MNEIFMFLVENLQSTAKSSKRDITYSIFVLKVNFLKRIKTRSTQGGIKAK